MPKYRITDNQTGKVVTVSGEKAPTTQEAEEIFKTAGLRQSTTPEPTMQPTQPQGNALTNFLPSLGNAVMSTGEGLINVLNPDIKKNTLANIGKLAFGTGEQIGQALFGNKNGYNSETMQMAGAAGNMYKNRYGGVENVKKTINEDPVGFLLDASTLLTAGGAGLTKLGQVSKVDKLAKAGQVASKVGQIIDPIQSGLTVAGKGVDLAGNTKIAQKLQKPFIAQYKPDAVKAANELGVELPISAQTNSKVLKGYEALLQKGLFGGEIGRKIDRARTKISQLGTDLTMQIDQSPDLKGIGKTVQTGFNKYQDGFYKQKGELYDAIPPAVAKTPADLTKTKQALSEIIGEKSGSLVGGTNIEFYQDLYKKLIDKPEDITLNNIRKTRTSIGQRKGNFADPVATGDQAALNKLYGALSDDMDVTIKNADPVYGKALDDANAYYRETIQKINSSLGKKIANADPEKLVDELIKPNSETSIATVKEVIGEEGFTKLQEGFMQKVFTKAINPSTKQLDLKKLNAQLNLYGEPTLNTILSKDQLTRLSSVKSQLEKIDVVDKAIKSGTKMAEGSQTAFLGETALLGGSAFANPLLVANYIVGKLAANKMFNSKLGQQFMTTGMDLTSPVVSKLQQSAQLVQKARPVTQGARIGQQAGNEQFDAIRRAKERLDKKQSTQYAPLP